MASPNFLGVAVQVYAGAELSEYSALVRQLRARVPVINETGRLGDDGVWKGWDGTEDPDILSNYRRAQYYCLFEPKRKLR